MNQYVLDNAVTMAWCFSDEATPYTENLLDRLSNLVDSAVVPALWLYEVTNVSMLAVRKGRITKAKAITFLRNLADLPIEVEPARSKVETFLVLADVIEQHKLTAYDAAYLELAIRRNLPLATLDTALIEACKTLGKMLV
ncbi:MAG: type II toxin-antitoxin system VapC family toxin [Acidobacteriaceae bacterium]|nr:type II toxin-antitoxin system VapC family toxin [Acidobacteriaceae bacterium]MBV9675738.1 type II toxin-antitoxin system VapC family toxin [Acidobacteriaceae bacterium]